MHLLLDFITSASRNPQPQLRGTTTIGALNGNTFVSGCIFFFLFSFWKCLFQGLIYWEFLESNIYCCCCRYQSLNLTHVPEHSAAIYEFRWHQPSSVDFLHSFSFLIFNGEKTAAEGEKERESVRSAQSRAATVNGKCWPVDKMQDKMNVWMDEMLLDSRLGQGWEQQQRLTAVPSFSWFMIWILLSVAEGILSNKLIW